MSSGDDGGRRATPAGIGDAFLGKVPPHDEDAEVSVLGSVILHNSVLDVVTDIVRPEDFYSEAHELIFRAMLDLVEHRQPVDLIKLGQTLKWKGELEAVGGPSYLSSVLDEVPTSANVKAHARSVRDLARVREMLGAALDVLQKGYGDFGDVERFIQESESAVMDAARARGKSNVTRLGRVVQELYDELVLMREGKLDRDADLGIPYGIPRIDRMTSGAQPEEFTVIAGPSSSGKTALALQVADHCPKPVLIFQLEQPNRQIAYRRLATHTGIPISRLRRPKEWTHVEADQIAEAAVGAFARRVWIDDRPGVTMSEIHSTARRQVKENDIGLLIIDYLGQVRPDPAVEQKGREQQLAHAVRGGKGMARALGVPTVLLCQINRKYTGRNDPRPQLEDLRGSGAIGHEADTVLFTWRPEQLKPVKDRQVNERGLEESEIIVGKCRNGEVGIAPTWWDGPRMLFKERAFDDDAPPGKDEYGDEFQPEMFDSSMFEDEGKPEGGDREEPAEDQGADAGRAER